MYIKFSYVENYPDEGPEIELRSLEGLDDSHITCLEELLKEKVNMNNDLLPVVKGLMR